MKNNQLNQDIQLQKRVEKASNANKKYPDELVMKIKEYRDLGHTYKEIMEKFNIPSKGTVSNLLNSRLCITKLMQVQHSGQCVGLPNRGREFDSLYLLCVVSLSGKSV